jgi:hypothetical protein
VHVGLDAGEVWAGLILRGLLAFVRAGHGDFLLTRDCPARKRREGPDRATNWSDAADRDHPEDAKQTPAEVAATHGGPGKFPNYFRTFAVLGGGETYRRWVFVG